MARTIRAPHDDGVFWPLLLHQRRSRLQAPLGILGQQRLLGVYHAPGSYGVGYLYLLAGSSMSGSDDDLLDGLKTVQWYWKKIKVVECPHCYSKMNFGQAMYFGPHHIQECSDCLREFCVTAPGTGD